MKWMELNRSLSYITSYLMLSIFLTAGINYDFLTAGLFWSFTVPLSLPGGLLLELVYSSIYTFCRRRLRISEKIWLKKNPKYVGNREFLDKYIPRESQAYQTFLSEINTLRSVWVSALIAGIVMIFIGLLDSNNTILETWMEVWLPVIFVLGILGCIRIELILKSIKKSEYEKKEKANV